jgi:hypothetical protein
VGTTPALDLLHELLLPPADVLRFSESGPEADAGNLPLDHGLELLAGVRKALVAATCSVIRPRTFHPRLSLADAEQFLRQCRLGQTERGSFTVTVACPLDAVPGGETLFDRAPFGRQVTVLLLRSLNRLSRSVELGQPEAVVEPAVGEAVLSANLCEGLLDMMTPAGEGSALTISVSWARTLAPPPDASLPRSIRLRRASFTLIEEVADRLRPARAPQPQTLVGFADTLDGRPNDKGRREGPVILQVVPSESEVLRVRADLNADDYHAAWLAHEENRPVTLRGILRRGRLHRVTDVTDFSICEQPASHPEAP